MSRRLHVNQHLFYQLDHKGLIEEHPAASIDSAQIKLVVGGKPSPFTK